MIGLIKTIEMTSNYQSNKLFSVPDYNEGITDSISYYCLNNRQGKKFKIH
jgi:hypothetical protein